MADKKSRTIGDYPYTLPCETRWVDNDQYGHVNNAVYYIYFDSIVNTYLKEHCGAESIDAEDPNSGTAQLGYVVSSNCQYFDGVSFPQRLTLGLRIVDLGKSSVRYEVAVFLADGKVTDTAKAVGEIVHVFVDRSTRRPNPQGMAPGYRAGLSALLKRQSKL